MRKRVLAGAAVAVMLLACKGGDVDTGGVKEDQKDPGTVNRLVSGTVVSSQDNGTAKYTIRIQVRPGDKTEPVTVISDANREEYLRCKVGTQWPACRKG